MQAAKLLKVVKSDDAWAMSSYCQKFKQKIRQLAHQGKLSLSNGCSKRKGRLGQSVLDLGKGYFSAGCRKDTSGTII